MKKKGNALCALIKMYRKKLNLSQSDISKDICVSSYVSKIENGETEPNIRIAELLLKKMGVDYHPEDEFSGEESVCVFEYFNSLFDFDGHRAATVFTDMKKNEEKYLASDYVIEYSLAEWHHLISDDEGEKLRSDIGTMLSSVENLMSARESGIYYFLKALAAESPELKKEFLKIAVAEDNNGYYFYQLGFAMLAGGNYMQSLKYLDRADTIFMEEGNFRGLVFSKSIRGEVYHLLRDFESSKTHYEAVINLLEKSRTDDDYILGFKYFSLRSLANIAYKSGYFEKAVKICERIIEDQKRLGKTYTTAPYLLLSDFYFAGGEKKRAAEYLQEARKASDYTLTVDLPFERELHRLYEYRIRHGDYLKSGEYESILLKMKDMVENRGFFDYQEVVYDMLKEFYVANKKYKDAYIIAEK